MQNRKLSEYGKLVRLALPIMGSQLLHTLYNLADTWFLGKVGPEALSAPSISFSIIFFLIVFGMAFSAAGTTLISQSLGRKDQRKVNFYLGQTGFLLFGVSLVIMVAGFLTARPLLGLLQTPADVMEEASSYLLIIFWGIPFLFIHFLLNASFQAVGDSLTPLYVQIVTVVLNIVLDAVLIFGWGPFPEMGIAGAAWATVFSRGVAAVISLVFLFRGKGILKLRLRNCIPRKDALLKLLSIGLPASIGQGISALGFSIMQGLINRLGIPVIAAFGVGNRIFSLFNMPAQGLCQALTVLVGQRLGAGKADEARRFVRQAFFSILVVVGIPMLLTTFWGHTFIRFFIDDPAVIAEGVVFFRILSFSVLIFNCFTVITGAFQGGGDTRPVMFLNIFRLWGVRLPVGYLLSVFLGWGAIGIWIGMVLSNILTASAGYLLYRTDRWAKKIEEG